MNDRAAQQPEAPPTQDDVLMTALRLAAKEDALARDAAARIRELEAEVEKMTTALDANWIQHQRTIKAEAELAASRERERAERKRGDELWQRCETLALLVEKYVQCYTRQWNPLNGIAEANTDLAIAKRLATPDSAASPTGGEG